jgi:hypothetical protein
MDEQRFREWISEEIERFVREDPGNRLERLDGSPIFQPPLVGFVSGSDPVFRKIKEVVGEFYMTPLEAVEKIAEIRGVEAPPEDRIGIVSFILPISNETRRENAKTKDAPSERWAHTRLFGEEFNRMLQQHLVTVLEQKGYFVAAPEMEEKLFRMLVDQKVGWASTWSQRHVAFAADLGTFGLSDGLITRAGKAHRVGSVVVDQPLESPQRTDDIHRAGRELQEVHRAMPRRCDQRAGARQADMRGLRPQAGSCHQGELRHRHLRLRPVSDRRLLREANPRQGRLISGSRGAVRNAG